MTGVDVAAIPHIRQQHDYGCGLASLAMISGKSYDDVRGWLLANWPGGQEKPEAWLTKHGIHGITAEWYLSQHGYVWRTLYAGWNMPTWPPEPFAPVHLANVRQPSNNSHFVVMRADGVVFDPLSDEPKRLTDWPEVSNVVGVWSLDALAVAEQQRDDALAKIARVQREVDASGPRRMGDGAMSYVTLDRREVIAALTDRRPPTATPTAEPEMCGEQMPRRTFHSELIWCRKPKGHDGPHGGLTAALTWPNATPTTETVPPRVAGTGGPQNPAQERTRA